MLWYKVCLMNIARGERSMLETQKQGDIQRNRCRQISSEVDKNIVRNVDACTVKISST